MSSQDLQQQLQDAMSHGWPQVEAVLRAGAEINALLPNNSYILHAAIERDDLSLVQHLLMNDANPNMVDKDGKGYAALALAVIFSAWGKSEHKLDMLHTLIRNGANIDQISGGSTALIKACLNKNSYGEAEFLLQNGADVNLHPDNLDSALQTAVLCNLKDTVSLLLQYGAHVAQSSSINSLDTAKKHGFHEVAAIIEQHLLTQAAAEANFSLSLPATRNVRSRL